MAAFHRKWALGNDRYRRRFQPINATPLILPDEEVCVWGRRHGYASVGGSGLSCGSAGGPVNASPTLPERSSEETRAASIGFWRPAAASLRLHAGELQQR